MSVFTTWNEVYAITQIREYVINERRFHVPRRASVPRSTIPLSRLSADRSRRFRPLVFAAVRLNCLDAYSFQDFRWKKRNTAAAEETQYDRPRERRRVDERS